MEQILLTPEEIEIERNKTYTRLNIEVDPLSVLEDELEVLQDSNKAQLKKVLEILDEIETNVDPHGYSTGCPSCGEEVGTAGEVEMGIQMGKDRAIQTIKQAILKEAGLGK